MSPLAADRVADTFVEFADTLVEEFDLIEFLHMVTSTAADLAGSSAAGLLLTDAHGQLQFMAASDERTELLELFQIQMAEGPCLDCFRQGAAVVNADLRDAYDRWPRFAPQAVAIGFRSVHAFPLRLRREVIGALNLFSVDVGSIDSVDARTVQALADVATIGLLQERAVQRGEVLAEQLQGALNSRIVIEQAKGAIAQAHGCTIDEAFIVLRTYCRNNGLKLSAVAREVVTTPTSVPELTSP